MRMAWTMHLCVMAVLCVLAVIDQPMLVLIIPGALIASWVLLAAILRLLGARWRPLRRTWIADESNVHDLL